MADQKKHDAGAESGEDFEKPKDEFMFFMSIYKLEERKMLNHIKFEQITSRYWSLLPKAEDGTVSKLEYTQLLTRMYKVLLPLYQEEEMEKEIDEEWIFDCKGRKTLDLKMFSKVLFRIAHNWAINIDIDEYIDILQKVHARITCKYHKSLTKETKMILPTLEVGFPADEKRVKERGNLGEKDTAEEEWIECLSDESSKSIFEYKYEEEADNMVLKKYKRPKAFGNQRAGGSIKEPFIYEEKAVYDDEEDPSEIYVEGLLPLEHVVPLGFVAEQYLTHMKNEMHKIFLQNSEKASALGDMGEIPSIPVEGNILRQKFALNADTEEYLEYNTFAMISDGLLDNFRKLLKEATEITLRQYSPFPKPGSRAKTPQRVGDLEPISEVSKVGFNPILDRRINWEVIKLCSANTTLQYNTNFMFPLEELVHHLDCNINKVKNGKDFLLLKDPEQVKREDELMNTAPYKQMKTVMLNKKFEGLLNERSKTEEKEQKRLKKMQEREEMQKAGGKFDGKKKMDDENSLTSKLLKGAFHQFESKAGIREDPCVSDLEVIKYARQAPLVILLIGKPRSGKTTTAMNLSASLDLIHIDCQRYIDRLLAKIATYEAPDDLEEGQEPPKWLSDFEEELHRQLKSGNGPNDQQIIEMLNLQIESDEAQTKGFILDLPFYKRKESWTELIKKGELKISHTSFSYIVELLYENPDISYRAENIRLNPDDGKSYSKWERDERKKPKVKKLTEEEEDEPVDEEEDENKPKPLDENKILKRVCDLPDFLSNELKHYHTIERPAFDDFIIRMYDNQFIKLDAAGLTPDQINNSLVARIKGENPLRPLAKALEPEGELKGFLNQGLEEGQVPRSWSIWKQTDPVALFDGKVIMGQPDFAATYADRVFLFGVEENLNRFISNPKKYLQKAPEMPAQYRLLLQGPSGSGKKSQAKKLADKYGWKIIDFKQLVKDKVVELSQRETHQPNNPLGGYKIGLSEQESLDINDGKNFEVQRLVPWVLDYLGHPLEKKRPPPPEKKEGEEGEEGEEGADAPPPPAPVAAKKEAPKEQKPPSRHSKEGDQSRLEDGQEEEEVVVLDDLSIDEIALKINEETGKAPFVGGFILHGFPETEEQLAKLKEHGIEFDKVIFFIDQDEENPGEILKKRNAHDFLYDFDVEMENIGKIKAFFGEQLGEEIVRDVALNGSQDEVFARICTIIDPFYPQVDDQAAVKISAELGEEEKPLQKGEYGDFCPVTFANDSWLFPGNPELEQLVKGRTYKFSGEREMEEFKKMPTQYIYEGFTLPPLPHIMITGTRGAGVSSQIHLLCEKYKLNEFKIRGAFEQKLKEEKEKRKRGRLLARGFKPLPPPEEEGEESPPDPEIEDDPEDFDKAEHEKAVMREVIKSDKAEVYDADWFDVPEDTTPLIDLLNDSRRLPEVLIVVNTSLPKILDRSIDHEAIKAKYEKLLAERNEFKRQEREKDRAAKLEELKESGKEEEEVEEEMKNWDNDKAAEDEEEDPEAPNLEKMIEEQKEQLTERKEKDQAQLEEFIESIRGKNVPVIMLNGDLTQENILTKMLHSLNPYMELRKNFFERFQIIDLKKEEVPFYEQSYLFEKSKYGVYSPMHLENPKKSKEHALVYRDKIYYFSNEEEKKKFMDQPALYVNNESVPLDIHIKPQCFAIGLPRAGKSTLCEKLSEAIGIVHLHIHEIIDELKDSDCILGQRIKDYLGKGLSLDEDLLVQVVAKRIQYQDCFENGYILEGFPKTRNQAVSLSKKGIIPNHVFNVESNQVDAHKRTFNDVGKEFFADRTVLKARANYFDAFCHEVIAYYQKYYENVRNISASKSKWYMEDEALKWIEKSLQSRMRFARDMTKKNVPALLENMTIDRTKFRINLSEFKYFCPVTWKNIKCLENCKYNRDNIIRFNNCYFFFKGEEEKTAFLKNPKRFVHNSNFPQIRPKRIKQHKASELLNQEKYLTAYCPVSLVDESKIVKGDNLYLIIFNENRYVFDSEAKVQRFLKFPKKYIKAQLPVKVPPPTDKVSLAGMAQLEDSIAFLEQSIGQMVTRALLEIGCNRLKYPTLSVRETLLKLFALFLKANNPTNSQYIQAKYKRKMQQFIERCELPVEIYNLSKKKGKSTFLIPKDKKKEKGTWNEFKEKYYNELGAKFDRIVMAIDQEKSENFMNYIR